jgi:putative endonuclease
VGGALVYVMPVKTGIHPREVATEWIPAFAGMTNFRHARENGHPKGNVLTMNKPPAVYILASKKNGTLYTGVTSDLTRRIWEHRNNLIEGFTSRYEVHRLVYFEQHTSMEEAILREKRIKKWNRAWKIKLIEERNPGWEDLWLEL